MCLKRFSKWLFYKHRRDEKETITRRLQRYNVNDSIPNGESNCGEIAFEQNGYCRMPGTYINIREICCVWGVARSRYRC